LKYPKIGSVQTVVALSEPLPADNWDGPTGFIHQCAYYEYLAGHKDPTEIEYYLCGTRQQAFCNIRAVMTSFVRSGGSNK